MEKSRKTFLEEAVIPELNQIKKHIPALWDRFFSEHVLKNTVFGKNKKLSPVAAQPLPQGYINYDNNEIETLPEQELLRLVGYDHLHMALADDASPAISDQIDNALSHQNEIRTIENVILSDYISRMKSLQNRMEEIYPRIATVSSRSKLVSQLADEKYIEMIEISQNRWAKVFERPLDEVKALQNAIIDSTHLNHIDIDHLFQRNWAENGDLLAYLTPAQIVTTFMSIKHETGITFGNDLGILLLKCPEFITLDPKIVNDRKKSFIGWGFDGPDLGNIIRNSPETFLSNHYDDTEAKIQYLLMRMNAPRDTIAELGLLDIDIRELSAKYEFLYRRGLVLRPNKKERRLEKKKHGHILQEQNQARNRQIIADIYYKKEEEFLEFARCSREEFDIWCKSWNAEIDACDGLAHEHLYALLGMKIPFIVNKDFINAQSYAGNKFNSIVKNDLNHDHTRQVVWEIDDDDQDDGALETQLFIKLREYGAENNFYKFEPLETSLAESDLNQRRWRKNYVKISNEDLRELIRKKKYLDIDDYE